MTQIKAFVQIVVQASKFAMHNMVLIKLIYQRPACRMADFHTCLVRLQKHVFSWGMVPPCEQGKGPLRLSKQQQR
jgi:hypothetical protein